MYWWDGLGWGLMECVGSWWVIWCGDGACVNGGGVGLMECGWSCGDSVYICEGTNL